MSGTTDSFRQPTRSCRPVRAFPADGTATVPDDGGIPFATSIIIGRLSLFLSALARTVARDGDAARGPTHPAVVHAMRLMEAWPDHRWTLSELADQLHLAPGYVVRLFKCATGLPPMAYLSRHRVELAATRLLHTDEPIAHIARSVGWPDQNYFARLQSPLRTQCDGVPATVHTQRRPARVGHGRERGRSREPDRSLRQG